jgi:hypothetical protein
MPLSSNSQFFSPRTEGAADFPLGSAARTVTGTSSTYGIGAAFTGIIMQVNVTAVSGTTPTLVVSLQDSVDGGTNFIDVAGSATASITATGFYVVRLNAVAVPVTPTLRVLYTIGGTTPSFTFQVATYAIRA